MMRYDVIHSESDADGVGVVGVMPDQEGGRSGEFIAILADVEHARLVDDPDQSVTRRRVFGRRGRQIDHPPGEFDLVWPHFQKDGVDLSLRLGCFERVRNGILLGVVLGLDPGKPIGQGRLAYGARLGPLERGRCRRLFDLAVVGPNQNDRSGRRHANRKHQHSDPPCARHHHASAGKTQQRRPSG